MSPALNAQYSSPLDTLLQDGSVANLTDELEEVDRKPIACGGFSYVYKYRARQSSSINIEIGSSLFAVKAITFVGSSKEKEKKLEREIRIWASLDHPNILKLHGIVDRDDAHVSLISDFMSHGTAVAYLKDVGKGNIIDVSREIASGLAFLHARNIAHGDIKGDNILITSSGRACIGDFGLSRAMRFDGSFTATTTDANRACRWTAVEYLDFTTEFIAPSLEGDVWSFGCTILQLISGELPYYDILNNYWSEGQVVLRIQSGELPKFPPVFHRHDFEKYREGISAFCQLCWIKDRASRPSITTLMHVLNSFCLDMHCNLFRDNDDINTPNSNGASTSSSSILNDQPETSNVSDNNGSGTSSDSRSRSSSQSTIGPESNLQQNASDDSIQSEYHDQEDVPQTQTEASSLSSGASIDEDSAFSDNPADLNAGVESNEGVVGDYTVTSYMTALSDYLIVSKGSRRPLIQSSSEGPKNAPNWTVSILIDNTVYGSAIGPTKKVAQDQAAKQAYLIIENEEIDLDVPYLPIFMNRLNVRGISFHSQFKWSYVLAGEGVEIGKGEGSTLDWAKGEAARNAALVF